MRQLIAAQTPPGEKWQPATPDYERLTRLTAALDPPLAAVDVAAFDANAADLHRRVRGVPIRVASKSVRCRALLDRVLARPGFAGVLAFSLAEALWLAGEIDDVVVAYPTADRTALAALAHDEQACRRVTVMVDSEDQLDLVDAVAAPAHRGEVRVCLDLDASLRALGGRVHVGTRRSPVHRPTQAVELARRIATRPGFRLVGLMAYEGQIAGVGNAPPGRPLRGLAVRLMQQASAAELAARRARVVEAVRGVADLEFVNGGGTGSADRTAAETAITEVAAGSGLYGPALFDHYRDFRVRPAAVFALPVVRKPSPDVVTVFTGGWVASGPPGPDRLPVPVHPAGLRLSGSESAGEVQTPLLGSPAGALRIGDRVWFRHAKAGELCEHVNNLHLAGADDAVQEVPTYRGEGKAFG
jgi:D-serine deaminase-like pyridoxal phosphate-dependent protein